MVVTLREERDPAFWDRVSSHPAVAPTVTMGRAMDWAASLAQPAVIPLAAEHGGLIMVRLDGIGRVHEMHTMFTPEGWGREAMLSMAQAIQWVFVRGSQLVTTYELEGEFHSLPPKTFRFAPCGDFSPVEGVPWRVRTWSLARLAWDAAPARRRI